MTFSRATRKDHEKFCTIEGWIKPWCQHRTAADEYVVTVALTRTLSTQGLVLRLPPELTIGDGLSLPSLTAALLLGLRETIGGEPDHLRVMHTVDPVLSDGSSNIQALLIHDYVPGGTGYLANLADDKQLRAVLEIAWQIVRDCECKAEGRASCHRYLLPYAAGGDPQVVSRASAERGLRLLVEWTSRAMSRRGTWFSLILALPAASR